MRQFRPQVVNAWFDRNHIVDRNRAIEGMRGEALVRSFNATWNWGVMILGSSGAIVALLTILGVVSRGGTS
jgi:hypothetical protein